MIERKGNRIEELATIEDEDKAGFWIMMMMMRSRRRRLRFKNATTPCLRLQI